MLKKMGTDGAVNDLQRASGERSMTDKRRRAIAALEVELAMTEAHARKLSSTAPTSGDPNQHREIAALIKEENERAEKLKEQLRLLRDQS